MSQIIENIKSIVLDIKTYLVVKLKYSSRYKYSKIQSFVFPNTKIGKQVNIKENCLLSSDIESIGNGTYIGSDTKIFECISIGNFCSISHNVRIGLSNHALDHISTNPLFYHKDSGFVDKTTYSEKEKKRTIIENDVLISANVIIMSGVTIGTGSVIGAGSFVNKDVKPYSIVAGTPAKEIRKRFSEDLILQLLKSKWWNMPLSELKKHQVDFNNPSAFLKSIAQNLKNEF